MSLSTESLKDECLEYQTFDFDHLIYTKPRKEKGRYVGKIKYKVVGKKAYQKIIIKTPRLKCMEDVKIAEDRCSIELQLFNNNVDFYQFLIKFDDKNIMTAFRNRQEWFGGQDFPLDIIDEFYKPVLKMNSNKCPTMKVKIMYDELKNFDTELLKKDAELIFYIECLGLRFLHQQFTMIWKLNRFTVPPNENASSGDDDYYERELINRDGELSEILSNESSDDYEETETPTTVPPSIVAAESPKDIATELPKEMPKELPKEMPKEMPKEIEKDVVEVKKEEIIDKDVKVVVEKQVMENVSVSETVGEAVATVVGEAVATVVDGEVVKDEENQKVIEAVEKEINKLEERLDKMEKVEGDKGVKKVMNKKRVIKCANNRRRIWL